MSLKNHVPKTMSMQELIKDKSALFVLFGGPEKGQLGWLL